MITEVDGNLLEADVDALVNAVNTVGVMGKGIALDFRHAFPANYQAYRRACELRDVTLGTMFVVETGQPVRPRYIINFPTKGHWRARSDLGDVKTGLADLREVIVSRGIASVAVPALGCGLGGLAWTDVEPLIRDALGDLSGVDVRLYVPRPL